MSKSPTAASGDSDWRLYFTSRLLFDCLDKQSRNVTKKPLRIMVVDDNVPDVVLINESLREQQMDFVLTHSLNGQDALETLNATRERPDLMILDLNMPKLNGFEVLTRLRSTSEFDSIPVLVLTSSLVPGEKEQALRMGATRFLRKPHDLDEFLNSVASAVREISSEAQLATVA
jgi:CheY-like chemotaxis protein